MIVSLDAVEAVVDEAITTDANLIVSHHPIIFSGLKSLTGANYIERTIIKAIKNDIAIYAIHTNLDNIVSNGVNEKLVIALGLNTIRPLVPQRTAYRYQLAVSDLLKPDVVQALKKELDHDDSAFHVAIDEQTRTTSDWSGPRQSKNSQRSVGHFEARIRAYGSGDQSTKNHWRGADRYMLDLPMAETHFLAHIKDRLNLDVIRHTALLGKSVQKIALCGGSGSFLLSHAIRAGADFFITGDFKYHQFFDADGRIVIADVGHYESEQFTIDLLVSLINTKFSNFAARYTETRTNPVYYFI